MKAWPLWAQRAYCAGRLMESPNLARQQSTITWDGKTIREQTLAPA